MNKDLFKTLSALSVSLGANIRLLDQASKVCDKNSIDFFILELKKDRERLRDILGMLNK